MSAHTIRALCEWLTGRRAMIALTPAADPFAEAWTESDDLDAMIELLLLGGRIRLFGIDGTQTWSDAHGAPPKRWLFRLRTPEGRYVRVDVHRAKGAAGLRAILPALPPLSAWRAASDAIEAMRDPLAQYLLDVEHRGRPSAAWTSRWGEGDVGLRAAWATSTCSLSMREVLRAAGRDREAERAQAAAMRVPLPPRDERRFAPVDEGAFARFEAELVAAVRAAVPDPFAPR